MFTINEITRFRKAELDQELFDRIYGEGVITSEEEFRKRIDEEIAASLREETGYKLSMDLRKLALDKSEFELPEDFLKRWLLKVNEDNSEEQIEKEFGNFTRDLKWQLIRNKIARDNEIKITPEELQKEAENITRQQFRQYGLFYATDEQVTHYANETLKREEDAKRIDQAITPKLGLVFQPTKDMSLFASYSNSFTPNSGITIYNETIKPSIIDQVEAGIKKEFLDVEKNGNN